MVIGEDDTTPGLIFGPRHSRRHHTKDLSYTDFADDIVLLFNTLTKPRGYYTYSHVRYILVYDVIHTACIF